MTILMCGLGSIGQRHLRNIRRLYGDSVKIIAYRSRGLQMTFSDDMQIRKDIDLEDEYNIKSFSDLSAALAEKPNIAFISNITAKHIECALAAAKAGCDLFIEKPLSNDLKGVTELIDITNKGKLIVFMGFQNRYHPCLMKMKALIENGDFGNIVSVSAAVGERLTTMHTYEDYRGTYMARSDYGGGVVLNQLIHEIDYLRWIYGEVASVFAVGGQMSNLEMDVEDIAEALLTFKNGARKIPVRVHADFLQYPPERYCEVICDKGKIKTDIINNSISWILKDKEYTQRFDDFKRNDMFIAELESFFGSVKSREVPAIDLSDGIESLKIALAIKDSMKTDRIISL